MEIEAMKKQTVERLKRVKKEQELSYSKIMDMLSSKGYYLSEPTLKKVFSENSDTYNFKYRDTIAPLADVLLDLYGDATSETASEEVKHLIREKNKMIEILLYKNEEQSGKLNLREKLYSYNYCEKSLEYIEHSYGCTDFFAHGHHSI